MYTYRIIKECLEQLATHYTTFQFFSTSWVFVQKHSVCEQPTRLPW